MREMTAPSLVRQSRRRALLLKKSKQNNTLLVVDCLELVWVWNFGPHRLQFALKKFSSGCLKQTLE
jgi:hypothetical protein